MGVSSARFVAISRRHLGRTFDVAKGVELKEEMMSSSSSSSLTLAATSRIEAGVRAVTTPFAAWATRSVDFAASSASNDARFGAIFNAMDAGPERNKTMMETVLMTLHVLNERMMSSRDVESDDSNAVYAATYPDSMYFADACLDESRVALLEGTSTRRRLESRAEFTRALSRATSLPVEDIAWALGAVSSRAMKSDVVPFAFVPGCDLLDHSFDANCELRRDSQTHEVFAITRRVIEPGESLTLSYGDTLSNDRALRMYGFALANNPNDERVVFGGGIRGVHPASADFASNVSEMLRAHRDAPQIWLDEASKWRETQSRIVIDDDDDPWRDAVRTLREGQSQIIDAHVDALN
jgi:hypothetical protein